MRMSDSFPAWREYRAGHIDTAYFGLMRSKLRSGPDSRVVIDSASGMNP